MALRGQDRLLTCPTLNQSFQCSAIATGIEVTYGNLQRQCVWHPYYIDALAVSYNSSGDKHFYCHDANFNITLALDSSGNPVERYHYSPYGEVTFLNADFTTRSDSSIENEHLYTGRRTDPVTGLQLNRHRYYHAKLGRWVTRDPIGYEGSPWNLYEYVNTNPIAGYDPLGQKNFNLEECYKRCEKVTKLRGRRAQCRATCRHDEHHLNRNQNNICPLKEPRGGVPDRRARVWKRDNPTGEKWFHCGHRCYRSDHFQCCYDKEGGTPIKTGNCQVR